MAVGIDGHVGFIVDRLIGMGLVHLDQHIAAATVDDILGLEPVEMVGRILALLQGQQLLGVDLGVLVGHGAVAVADGDEGEAELVEVAHAVVGDVPAQHAVTHFVVLVTDGLPLLGGKVAEGGQVAAVLFTHGFQFAQGAVNFGTLHKKSSLS